MSVYDKITSSVKAQSKWTLSFKEDDFIKFLKTKKNFSYVYLAYFKAEDTPTFATIAKELGVSRSWIGQIKQKIEWMLKHPSRYERIT